MEKTLYQACKDFVNKVGAGNEFKTKEFTNEVGEYCTPTRWNLSNNNPYYRAHTYKTFFKKVRNHQSSKKRIMESKCTNSNRSYIDRFSI